MLWSPANSETDGNVLQAIKPGLFGVERQKCMFFRSTTRYGGRNMVTLRVTGWPGVVKQSIQWLIKHLIKVGARVLYHGWRW